MSERTSGSSRSSCTGRIRPVSRFRDGQRDDGDLRRREGRDEAGDVVASCRFDDAADELETVILGAALDQRVDAALRGEDLCRIRPSPGERGDPPAVGVRGVRGVPGLVGAMEGTEPEVHDPNGWDALRVRERVVGEKRGGGCGGHSLKTLFGNGPTSSSAICSATPRAILPSAT